MHCASEFQPQFKNLASIIRGFKSSVTTYARKNQILFDWQPRFHDHMIRTEADYNQISHYIINNPLKWKNDTLNALEYRRKDAMHRFANWKQQLSWQDF